MVDFAAENGLTPVPHFARPSMGYASRSTREGVLVSFRPRFDRDFRFPAGDSFSCNSIEVSRRRCCRAPRVAIAPIRHAAAVTLAPAPKDAGDTPPASRRRERQILAEYASRHRVYRRPLAHVKHTASWCRRFRDYIRFTLPAAIGAFLDFCMPPFSESAFLTRLPDTAMIRAHAPTGILPQLGQPHGVVFSR